MDENYADVQTFPVDLGDDFVVPDYPSQSIPMSKEKASEEAFYAAATESTNPLTDFLTAQKDLVEKGESALVEKAKQNWQKEQDLALRGAVGDLLGDTTIDPEWKKAMLNTYVSGGFISKDLRDRYMERQAVQDNALTIDQRAINDSIVDNLNTRITSMKEEEKKDKQSSFFGDVLDYAQATGSVVTKLATVPFAGLAGIYELLKGSDGEKAAELVRKTTEVLSEYTYNPTDAGAKEAEAKLGKFLEYLDVPAEWVGNQTLQATGSPGAATTARVILDPLNFIPLTLLKGRAAIKRGSPLDATREASPKNAEVAATAALDEPTGQLAESLGASKGEIIGDFVLPKVPDEILKENPDLAAKLIKEDKAADYSFELHRLDPNILDVEQRAKDMDIVLNLTKDPTYQQANSVISSPGINVFEGRATYGKDSTFPYASVEDAEFAKNQLDVKLMDVPPELRGTTSIRKTDNGWVVDHQWRKQYNDMDDIIFGADAVKSTFAGLSINSLKHTPIGKWLFTTGVFDPKYEAGKGRSVDRGLKQGNDTLKVVKENILSTPYKKELNELVRVAEDIGKEYFTQGELSARFPHLTVKGVKDLQTTHTMWRRIAHYEHRILNDNLRNELLTKGAKSAYNKDGKFISDVFEDLDVKEVQTIREAHDFTSATPYKAKEFTQSADGKWFDEQGRQLVRLAEPVTGEGYRFNYAVLDPLHKVDVLRSQPLPRITGWSPRRHLNHFFIDLIPRNLKIDGIDVQDLNVLRDYRKSIAGAKTQFEADKIKANLQEQHPNYEVVVRPERLDSYGNIRDDYQTSANLYAHSRKRGEGLLNTDIEDPLQSLINSARATASKNVSIAWEEATQKAFVKSYREFLKDGKFPVRRADIQPKQNMTKEEGAKFQSAVALYENYAMFKEYGYKTDTIYREALHKVADLLEGINIPANLIRDFSKHEFPLVSLPKKVGSILYINTNPLRQWVIQPYQAFELSAISPTTWAKTANDLPSIMTVLMGESARTGKIGKVMSKLATNINFTTPREEILKYAQAIKDTGILDSIDSNVMVNGVFNDSHKLMKEPSDLVAEAAVGVVKVPSTIGRSVGYDAAEAINKMGIWLQMRNLWEAKNPGKDWNTPQAKEWIANEVYRYSGNMNRAGNLPYQKGMLSPLFQFSAIGHKLFMNLLQNNATALPASARWKLGAMRATTMGLKYGVPGGGLMYAMVDRYGGEETRKNADLIKRGLSDYLVNESMNTYFPSDRDTATDLNISRSISPYGERGLPYADQVMEFLKFTDGNEVTNPRYPLFGVTNSLYELSNKWNTLWNSEDYSSEQKFEVGFREALSITSGFNNWFKANLMIGAGEKLNKFGEPNGLRYTVAEGYGQLFGFQSMKEEYLYEQLAMFSDNEKNLTELAEHIYKEISYLDNMFNEDGTPVDKLRQMSHALNIAQNSEGFTPEAKQAVMEKILELSARDKNPKTNLIRNWILNSEKLDEDRKQKALSILQQDGTPEMQELYQAIIERKP